MSAGWLTFWDSAHSIYVNARHRDVHYSLIAQQIAALVASPQARVLDYGCGEALHADRVAAAAGELLLCEGAPRVRAGIAARFAGNAKIRAVAPEEVERLPDRSLDLIVLHSVAQYLTPEELAKLFALFHRLLNADGMLVVSDVIPSDVAASTDALALLRFGAAQRILHRRRHRPRPHGAVRLLALAHALRTDPLRRSGDDGQTRRGGIFRAARGAKHRPQSGAHGVHGAAAIV